jgi:hypothetical protein
MPLKNRVVERIRQSGTWHWQISQVHLDHCRSEQAMIANRKSSFSSPMDFPSDGSILSCTASTPRNLRDHSGWNGWCQRYYRTRFNLSEVGICPESHRHHSSPKETSRVWHFWGGYRLCDFSTACRPATMKTVARMPWRASGCVATWQIHFTSGGILSLMFTETTVKVKNPFSNGKLWMDRSWATSKVLMDAMKWSK